MNSIPSNSSIDKGGNSVNKTSVLASSVSAGNLLLEGEINHRNSGSLPYPNGNLDLQNQGLQQKDFIQINSHKSNYNNENFNSR